MGNGHCKDENGPGHRESWVAVAIGGGAAIGAAGSYLSAKESNKPKKGYTDQTTTQTPYKDDLYGPDIEAVLGYQRGLVQQGTPQLDKHGNITYVQLPTGSRPGAASTPGPGPVPGPTSGGGKLTSVNSPSSASKNRRGKAAKAGGAGANNPAAGNPGSGVTAGPNLNTPQGIFSEVARRGLEAGNTETVGGARNLMSNIWGAAGTTGGSTQAGAGAEVTGFEGYNPILDRQAQRLEGDAGNRVARDLLLGFLGENGRAGGAGTGAGNGSGVRAGTGAGGQGGANVRYRYQKGTSGNPTPKQQAQILPPGVPDTFAGSPDSYFEAETRKIMDEQANEAELQSVIDAMNADVERGMFRDLAQLDATAAGSGRFGGSTWAALNRDAREEALQEMLKTGSQVRVGDRESRRQARLAALAGVNQRDLGLLGANVQREGIAAGERSANAAAGAGARAAADQLELAKRGQDLAAISDLLGYEQFGMGQLTDIGGQLSGDRLGSLGMVPGLEGIGLSGLNTALGAGGGMVDMRGQDVQSKIASQQAGIARQGLNQQLGMFNAGQGQGLVNNYLGTLMNIGQMGGTSRTQGTNVVPGLGVSPTGAALTGAAGGAATGAGLYNMYRGY